MLSLVSPLRRRAIETLIEFDETRAAAELSFITDALKTAKRKLMIAITQSKKGCWLEMIGTVNDDPFGKPYNIVMRELRCPSAISSLEPQTLGVVLDGLFPKQPTYLETADLQGTTTHSVTPEEVNDAIERVRPKKTSSGPDNITTKIIWVVNKAQKDLLRKSFNRCLSTGVFPVQWKEFRVALIKKGSRPDGVASSYRPLCLLNDLGKLLEHLLAHRLDDHIALEGGLAGNQYGFRKDLSTDDAVSRFTNSAFHVINQKKFFLAVSIDIKNAFNTIKWEDVLTAMADWETPPYLLRIFCSYFSDRKGECTTYGEEPTEVDISCGVLQGSVVGPLLWNLTHN